MVYDKASCVAYKEELDRHLDPEASTIVMSKSRGDSPSWAKWTPGAEELEQVVARFNDPADPLKILIVTAKLLTGFDAPILHCQYLDKPLKEHTLLQAITRTNRVYPPHKTHGLIVDYLGIFDDVAKSLAFDDESVLQVISNIEELKKQLAPAMAAALAFFPGVDRTVGGYEGLVQAQSAIADPGTKDAFGLAYSIVSQLWEAISPDPMLAQYRDDYRWLTDVYESVRPSDIAGRLVWHALGAKTIDLINEHVQVEIPQGAETIVLDAQTIEDLMLGKRTDVPHRRDREADHRPDRPPPQQPGLHRARPAPQRAAGEVRRHPAVQPRLPARAARAGPRHRRGREGRRRGPPRGARQGRADRALRGPARATRPRSSSRTSSTGSTRSSAPSASRAGSPPSAATRKSVRPCARRCTCSSRSATTTSSRRRSGTSGSTTDGRR